MSLSPVFKFCDDDGRSSPVGVYISGSSGIWPFEVFNEYECDAFRLSVFQYPEESSGRISKLECGGVVEVFLANSSPTGTGPVNEFGSRLRLPYDPEALRAVAKQLMFTADAIEGSENSEELT